MPDKYILDANGEPQACDLMTWAKWFENDANRRVARTEFAGGYVSTVFLGLDHRFGGRGDPVLWETMIFGGPHDEYQQRYTSRADAEAGHLKAVELATADDAVARTEQASKG